MMLLIAREVVVALLEVLLTAVKFWRVVEPVIRRLFAVTKPVLSIMKLVADDEPTTKDRKSTRLNSSHG